MRIIGLLGINQDKITFGSSLPVDGHATDLLVALVSAVKGNIYLCGGGAAGYQENEKFTAAGIKLLYQDFTHPCYEQNSRHDFIPGLSIIDALMHCGLEHTRGFLTNRSAS